MLSTGRFEGRLFGTRRADGILKFLELLHLVLRLRGLPLFAIEAGKSEMCLRGKRSIFFKLDYL